MRELLKRLPASCTRRARGGGVDRREPRARAAAKRPRDVVVHGPGVPRGAQEARRAPGAEPEPRGAAARGRRVEAASAAAVEAPTAAATAAPTPRGGSPPPSPAAAGGGSGGGAEAASLDGVLAGAAAALAAARRRPTPSGTERPKGRRSFEETSRVDRMSSLDDIAVTVDGDDEFFADEGKEEMVEMLRVNLTANQTRERSYYEKRKRRRFDWAGGVARWDDGPASPGKGASTRRYVRHVAPGGGVSLEPTSAPLAIRADRVSAPLRRALDESLDRPFGERMASFRGAMDALRVSWEVGRVEFTVRRSHCLQDAYALLRKLPRERWRQPFFVKFAGEEGLDAGGLSRDFFRIASISLCDVAVGLFKYAKNDSLTYALNDDEFIAASVEDGGAWLEFAGRLYGKALLEGHHLGAYLNPVLMKFVAAEPVELEDLQLLDFELWRSLDQLAVMAPDVVESLALTFAVESHSFGAVETTELVPGGANVEVTAANVDDFVSMRWRERIFGCCAGSLGSLLAGLYDVVPPEALMLLSARELELVAMGVPEIDVDDWARSTVYKGAFAARGPEHPTVRLFWDEVRHNMDHERRALLVLWCTGSSQVPAQGFRYLQGRDGALRAFTLTSVDLSSAIFPRAHTCFNRIDLPLFTTAKELSTAFDVALAPANAVGFSMD
ncbi:ubiquitin protein ligase [Aureococcus anophagefferens]|uniref:HECT-type E3 ubiquitin transferase n=1 Tax=Aureococcus anophagefferens TaxID=44056 RepID=A0ABR1FQX8_AURAN